MLEYIKNRLFPPKKENLVKYYRDKHDLHICIFPVYEKELKWYRVYVTSKEGVVWKPTQKDESTKYLSYEIAELNALTEILKQKQ